MNYALYLKSKKWQDVRAVRLKKDSYTCQICGRKFELRVHHVNYNRVGDERTGDLITICERCHNDIHWNLVHNGEVSKEEMLRAMPITEEQYKFARGKND